MKKLDHPDCECHKNIGKFRTCDLTCMKCSKAKEVTVITRSDGSKSIKVEF